MSPACMAFSGFLLLECILKIRVIRSLVFVRGLKTTLFVSIFPEYARANASLPMCGSDAILKTMAEKGSLSLADLLS